MLHDYLVNQGIREACEISFVLPLPSPVPPSPDTSRALVAAFTERNIRFIPGRRVASVDGARKVAILDNGTEMQFDLFLGVPKHRVPFVVIESGIAENGWIPVNPRTLETKYPGVYAVGDGANTGTPKAGVFAEGTARAVARRRAAQCPGDGR
jgi:sulfide:quinone oxidoreductase